MKILSFVAWTAVFCYLATNSVLPMVMAMTIHDPSLLHRACLSQLIAVRLGTFFFTGRMVALRVTNRRVACATIVAIFLAAVLLSFDVLVHLLGPGRSRGLGPTPLGTAILILQVPVAMLGGWVGSRRAGRTTEESSSVL